jgi:hypothetical protein
MKRLQPFSVPSRFVFTDPDTEYNYEADSKKELIKRIASYREQNRLPEIDAIEEVLEHYWCCLPENRHLCEEWPLTRGWVQYIRGGIALLQNIAFKKMVTPAVAEKRAAVCVKCPFNIFPDKKGFLKWSDDVAYQATGGLKTHYHDKLGNCSICSCTLKAKVWYGGKLESNYIFPDFCWQRDKNNKPKLTEDDNG